MDLTGFNAAEVEPNQGFDALPAGTYKVIVIESERKVTASGRGAYLALVLQVIEGQFLNRKIYDNLNIDNPSETAVKIARGQLSSICRAVGVMTPRHSSELHGKPLLAKIKIEKDEQYGDKNKVVAYMPLQAATANPGVPQASQPAAPTPFAGAQQPQQPQQPQQFKNPWGLQR